MIIDDNKIGSIAWAMYHGLHNVKKTLKKAKEDIGNRVGYEGVFAKMESDIENAQNILDVLRNVEFSDDKQLMVVMYEDNEECDDCVGKGFIFSRDVSGQDQVQKCDECNVFKDDNQAQIFASNR